MFTGLVATQGKVQSLQSEGAGLRLQVESSLFDDTVELGESIAVNGVCLTVVQQDGQRVCFQLAPETLKRTNLGTLQPGSPVNLERSLRLGARMGGHWVQGHVDGIATLMPRQLEGDWEVFHFQLPPGLSRYLVEKGSITVNGVSLTVVSVQTESFTVALIPHTLLITNLGSLQPGDKVNLEVDILAKYVERLLIHDDKLKWLCENPIILDENNAVRSNLLD